MLMISAAVFAEGDSSESSNIKVAADNRSLKENATKKDDSSKQIAKDGYEIVDANKCANHSRTNLGVEEWFEANDKLAGRLSKEKFNENVLKILQCLGNKFHEKKYGFITIQAVAEMIEKLDGMDVEDITGLQNLNDDCKNLDSIIKNFRKTKSKNLAKYKSANNKHDFLEGLKSKYGADSTSYVLLTNAFNGVLYCGNKVHNRSTYALGVGVGGSTYTRRCIDAFGNFHDISSASADVMFGIGVTSFMRDLKKENSEYSGVLSKKDLPRLKMKGHAGKNQNSVAFFRGGTQDVNYYMGARVMTENEKKKYRRLFAEGKYNDADYYRNNIEKKKGINAFNKNHRTVGLGFDATGLRSGFGFTSRVPRVKVNLDDEKLVQKVAKTFNFVQFINSKRPRLFFDF